MAINPEQCLVESQRHGHLSCVWFSSNGMVWGRGIAKSFLLARAKNTGLEILLLFKSIVSLNTWAVTF